MEQEHIAATIAVLVVSVAASTAAFHAEKGERATAEFFSDSEEMAELSLEVADSRKERRKGLMFRESLAEGHGMLFVYPDEKERVFWMKNTYIPLDIIFVDSNRTVVDIDRAEPEPDTPEEELTRYRSSGPAKYVIEANQGFARKNGIEVGDRVAIENR
ncbi:MAG: DUF192 domain-containing protein [Candidatus Nanohaloarchaea archaeon]